MKERIRVVILGSTGSIGTQAFEVIEANPQSFEVVGIAAAGSQPGLVLEQARRHHLAADQVAIADTEAARSISAELGGTVLSGEDAARKLVVDSDADTVLNALVGSLGLSSTLAALDKGATLALANKESLVAGGQLALDHAKPGQIVPVDSEHSAMAQCLRAGQSAEVERLVLTASGGPFRGWSREEMWEVTPSQAAAHPTWSMGQMNTLNSATMVNKGLELIEACLLFSMDPNKIDVTVHPQSIVHSMVTFVDGGTIAQASPPSMKLPIAHALAWPERVAGAQPALDFSTASQWTFEPLDNAAFPAVDLARHAISHAASLPAVYNAANEQAAAGFLEGKIKFPQIVDIVAEVVEGADSYALSPRDIDDIIHVEKQARAQADALVEKLA